MTSPIRQRLAREETGFTLIGTPNTTSYCLSSTVGTKSWYKRGPGGDITTTACTGP